MQSNAQCARTPAHPKACSIPGDRASLGGPGIRMRRLLDGNRILVGRGRSVWFLPRLVSQTFRGLILTPLVRLVHPTDARASVGERTIRKTDGRVEGAPSVQSNANCQQRRPRMRAPSRYTVDPPVSAGSGPPFGEWNPIWWAVLCSCGPAATC